MNDKPKSVGAVVLGWWGAEIEADTRTARALGARLRRANLVEALSERAVIALPRAIGAAGHGWAQGRLRQEPERLALLVRTLAQVERNEAGRLAAALGGEAPLLSALRFQRLIRSPDLDALATALRRALPLAGNACNVAALAEDLVRWDEGVRVRWCFDYFGASNAAPDRASDPFSGPSPEEFPA